MNFVGLATKFNTTGASFGLLPPEDLECDSEDGHTPTRQEGQLRVLPPERWSVSTQTILAVSRDGGNPSGRCSGELVPVVGGHVDGELQSPMGAGKQRFFGDGDSAAAKLLKTVFDLLVQAVEQRAAAGQDDVLT